MDYPDSFASSRPPWARWREVYQKRRAGASANLKIIKNQEDTLAAAEEMTTASLYQKDYNTIVLLNPN